MCIHLIVEDGVGVWDILGGDGGCDGVVVAIVLLCLGDCEGVRERAIVSVGSSLIYGILHNWYAPNI